MRAQSPYQQKKTKGRDPFLVGIRSLGFSFLRIVWDSEERQTLFALTGTDAPKVPLLCRRRLDFSVKIPQAAEPKPRRRDTAATGGNN